MPYFDSGNIRLYYEDKGQGFPLVFLHGFSLDHRMWDGQIRYFSSKYRTIALDARGHGKSDAPETGYAREDRIGDVLNLLSVLGLPKVHLVGLSMGGGDSLAMAIEHQDKLRSLTLADTVAAGFKPKVKPRDPSHLINEKGIEEMKKLFMESSLSRFGEETSEVKSSLASMMSKFSGKPWTDPMKGKYPKRNDLKMAAVVRIPTFLIVGRKDISWLPLSIQLNETILDSRLVVLPGVGHMSNMEAPEKFNENLAKFLLEVDNTG